MENESVEKLRKEMKITRILTVLNSVIVAGLIIVLIVIMSATRQVLTYVESIKPTLDSFSEMDLNSFQTLMEELDVESLNRISNDLDVEGLNRIINEIDVNELEKATENINKAIESIEEFEKKFSFLFGGR